MKSTPYNDKEIVDEILLNNKKVLLFLYEHNFESLNKRVSLDGGNKKDTEDIFHDALLVLFVKIKNPEFQLTCSIHTFLQAIARNLWRRKLASNSELFSNVDLTYNEASEDNIDEEYVHIERRKLYLKHLADMPNDCKRLIKMIVEGLSLQEITRLIPYNSLDFTKTKRVRCKTMLYKKISNDPSYKNLKNERFRATGSIPRW